MPCVNPDWININTSAHCLLGLRYYVLLLLWHMAYYFPKYWDLAYQWGRLITEGHWRITQLWVNCAASIRSSNEAVSVLSSTCALIASWVKILLLPSSAQYWEYFNFIIWLRVFCRPDLSHQCGSLFHDMLNLSTLLLLAVCGRGLYSSYNPRTFS